MAGRPRSDETRRGAPEADPGRRDARFRALTGAGPDALITGQALLASYDWTFLFGPGFIAVVNALLLGSLMYRSGLVPRGMALLGLIGGPLVAASGLAVLFGLWEQTSAWSAIATIPEFVWELSLGIYLVVKGFRPSAITALDATVRLPESPSAMRAGS